MFTSTHHLTPLVSHVRNRFQDGVAYQEAVQYAMDNTDSKDTLIISTADHGHSVAYNGYCGRGSPVTGLCMAVDKTATEHTGVPNTAADGLPYTVISVGNGPGSVLYVSTGSSHNGGGGCTVCAVRGRSCMCRDRCQVTR